MSKLFLIIVIMGYALFLSIPCYSQNLTIPSKEFSISTGDSVIVEKGSIKKLDVWVLRSKSVAKANVKLGISSSLPEGVQINFMPQRGYFDYSEATISVNPETKPGTYLLIIGGTIDYKTKGHIIKLTIPPTDVDSIAPGNQTSNP